MFKRISTLLLFLLPFSFAKADTLTGQCGDSLYWFFDTETHHLDLTGKGKMNLNKYSAWTTKDITIQSIGFSDSITSIDSYAFEEQALTEVVIPASVKKFGNSAFANNLSLLRFEFNGEGYCEIGDKVLYNCKNLRYFKGATKMLAYNDALDTVIVTYGYALTNFYTCTYIDNTLAYDTRLSGKYDERTKKIKTFFLPSQIEVIGDYLLCNAVELSGIIIPNKTKTIGKASFLNCSTLDSLVFMGDGIENIGDSAFCSCSQLAKISLKDTLPPIIKAHTFEGVDRSIPIYVPLGSSQRYKEAPYWSEFYNFIEASPATCVDEVHVQHNAAKKVFLNGQLLIVNDDIIYNITGLRLPPPLNFKL